MQVETTVTAANKNNMKQVRKSTKECAEYNALNQAAIDAGLFEAVTPDVYTLAQENPRTEPKHHGGWKNEGCAVLPIGTVNLTTGKNALFGEVWHGWEENASHSNILVCEGNKFKVLHTCGGATEFIKGDTISLKHDQTLSRIGFYWKVVGTVPHTKEGLLKLKQLSGKSSLAFSTFK